jgi:hypothetical protein
MPLKKPNHKILLNQLARAIDDELSKKEQEMPKPADKPEVVPSTPLGLSLAKKRKGKPSGPIFINTARLLTL